MSEYKESLFKLLYDFDMSSFFKTFIHFKQENLDTKMLMTLLDTHLKKGEEKSFGLDYFSSISHVAERSISFLPELAIVECVDKKVNILLDLFLEGSLYHQTFWNSWVCETLDEVSKIYKLDYSKFSDKVENIIKTREDFLLYPFIFNSFSEDLKNIDFLSVYLVQQMRIFHTMDADMFISNDLHFTICISDYSPCLYDSDKSSHVDLEFFLPTSKHTPIMSSENIEKVNLLMEKMYIEMDAFNSELPVSEKYEYNMKFSYSNFILFNNPLCNPHTFVGKYSKENYDKLIDLDLGIPSITNYFKLQGLVPSKQSDFKYICLEDNSLDSNFLFGGYNREALSHFPEPIRTKYINYVREGLLSELGEDFINQIRKNKDEDMFSEKIREIYR